MNRSTKILIGLLVLLVVVAYFLLPSGKERETSYKPAELNLAIDSASIVKIDIQRQGKSVILENDGGKWMVTFPNRYTADASAITHLVGSVRKLKVGSPISSNPDKQSIFQVDSTGTRLTLTDRSGKSSSLIVGKTGPSYSEVYFRLADSKDVYLGEGLDTWKINQELKDWRDKKIFSVSPDSVKELTLTHKKKTFALHRDSTTWKSGTDTVATNVMASMLNTLSNLNANDFVDTLYQPKTQPFIVKVHTGEETSLSFFPQPPDSSNYFVQTSQSSQGFIINKWTVQELMKPIEKFTK